MVSGKDIPWSDLPKELVEKIGKCLHTHIDVLRFRAVCTTWRSSLPPFKSFPTFPLKLPLNSCPKRSPYHCNERKQPDLIESTVYLFQPPDSASSASPSSRGWLVKVAPTVDGKFQVMSPVTDNVVNVQIDPLRNTKIKVLPHNMPKVLNLLDFRISQVCKSYHVQGPYYSCSDCYKYNNYSKILISSNHAWNETTDLFSLMAIANSGQLSYLKSGDEYWTNLKGENCDIDDIILYKGKFYAVDRYGKTIQFDSSFNETIVSSILCNGGTSRKKRLTIVSSILRYAGISRKKRLVESCARLNLVDIVLDANEGRSPFDDKALEIKIYRLDEEQHEWIAVHTLGDRIFFAGDDCCFSVSSQNFGGCRRNCIYFANRGTVIGKYENQNFRYDPKFFGPIVGDTDKFYSSFGCMNEDDGKPGSLSKELVRRYTGLHHHTGVFTLEDGKIGSVLFSLEYADIFWPPPSWLNQARSDALDAIHSASSKLLAVADCIANSRSPNPLASHMSNGPLLHDKVEAPFDPAKELSRLVVERKYEEAFTAALQRNDASILS